MKHKVIAIVPSAGLGKRFYPNANKPFHNLMGRPLIVWSLGTLESVDEITTIIPVLKGEDMERGAKVFRKYNLSKIKRIALGGKERQDSVYNGLKLINDENSIVLIHDGARPLIERDLIRRVIKELEKGGKGGLKGYDGVILGVPLKDTIKEAKGEIIKKTLRRESLWTIQTPQVFPYRNILKAYESAMKDGFYSTDDSALIERYGGRVKIIMGSYRNIKITTPEDMIIAEYFLSRSLKT